jgi:hypothetical protein
VAHAKCKFSMIASIGKLACAYCLAPAERGLAKRQSVNVALRTSVGICESCYRNSTVSGLAGQYLIVSCVLAWPAPVASRYRVLPLWTGPSGPEVNGGSTSRRSGRACQLGITGWPGVRSSADAQDPDRLRHLSLTANIFIRMITIDIRGGADQAGRSRWSAVVRKFRSQLLLVRSSRSGAATG